MASDLNKLTVQQLKAKLTELGLDTAAKKKSELVARLKKHEAAAAKKTEVKENKESAKSEKPVVKKIEKPEKLVEDKESAEPEKVLDESIKEEKEEAVQEENVVEEEGGGGEDVEDDMEEINDTLDEDHLLDDTDQMDDTNQLDDTNLLDESSLLDDPDKTEAMEAEEETSVVEIDEEDEIEDDLDQSANDTTEPGATAQSEDYISLEAEESTLEDEEEKKKSPTKATPNKSDADKEKKDDEDTSKEENKEKKTEKKRWVNVQLGKKIDKFKYLNCVQNMSIKQKTKDFGISKGELRVKLYPITLDDLQDPVIKGFMEKCTQSSMNFSNTLGDDKNTTLTSILVLFFKRKSDYEDCVKTMKDFRDNLKIHHNESEMSLNAFSDEYLQYRTKTTELITDSTLLIPTVPKDVTVEDLWDMFPSAWDIVLRRTFVTSRFAQSPQKQQPGYAYVYFPNLEMSRLAVGELGKKDPPKNFEQMSMLPVGPLISYLKDPTGHTRRDSYAGGKTQGTPKDGNKNTPKAKQQQGGKQQKSNTPKTVTSIFSAEPIQPKSTGSTGPKGQAKGGRQGGGAYKQQGQNVNNRSGRAADYNRQRGQRGNQQQRQNRQDYNRDQGRYQPGPRNLMNMPQHGQQDHLGRMMSNLPPQQRQSHPSEKEQGLKVLGDLLSTLGRLPNEQASPVNALSQILQVQQQQQQQQQMVPGPVYREQNRGRGGDQWQRPPSNQSNRGNQQGRGNQRSQKRHQSPDMGTSGKRRRQDSTYDRTPGYGRQGGQSQYQSQDYGGTQRSGGSSYRGSESSAQGGVDSKAYESLDVVSRIVRASKELKDAMKRPGQSYGGQQSSYGDTGYDQASSSFGGGNRY